eukprot:scaffold15221_cov35-Phaeocystis_antarctica.AAC.2
MPTTGAQKVRASSKEQKVSVLKWAPRAPDCQGRQERKGILLSACIMRQTTAKPPHPCTRYGRDRHARAASVFARRAMTSSKVEDSWTEPESVLCRLYKSGLVNVRRQRAPLKLCTRTLPNAWRTPLPSRAANGRDPSLLMLAPASASSVVFTPGSRDERTAAGAAQERAARPLHALTELSS